MKNKIDKEHDQLLRRVYKRTCNIQKHLGKFDEICKKHSSLDEDLLFAAPQYQAMQSLGNHLKFLRDFLKQQVFFPGADVEEFKTTDIEMLIRFLDSYTHAFLQLCGFLESYEILLKTPLSTPPSTPAATSAKPVPTGAVKPAGKAGQKAKEDNDDDDKAGAIIGNFVIKIAKSATSPDASFPEVEALLQQDVSAIAGHDLFILLMLAINSRNRRLLELLLARKVDIQAVIKIDPVFWKRAQNLLVELAKAAPKNKPVITPEIE